MSFCFLSFAGFACFASADLRVKAHKGVLRRALRFPGLGRLRLWRRLFAWALCAEGKRSADVDALSRPLSLLNLAKNELKYMRPIRGLRKTMANLRSTH